MTAVVSTLMSWQFLDYLSYCKPLNKYSVLSSQSNIMRKEANFEELDIDGVVLKHFCLFLGISFTPVKTAVKF
jgi:hypothetical protein